MKKYLIVFFLACVVWAVPTLGQTPAPAPLFSCATDAIGVHLGGTTNPGTDVNCAFNITKSWSAETHNLLVPATGGQDYFAGVGFTPDLSKLFGKTNLPKNTFQPFFHAAIGAARTAPSVGPTLQHYGGFAGAGVRYDPTGSGKFVITPVRFDFYDHPGVGKSPHGWLVGAGIQYVFGHQ